MTTSSKKKEHFWALAEIAALLIENDLDKISENLDAQGRYIVLHGDKIEQVTCEQLTYILEGNMDIVRTLFGSDLWDSLEDHLKAEDPATARKGFRGAAAEEPLKLVKLLNQSRQERI